MSVKAIRIAANHVRELEALLERCDPKTDKIAHKTITAQLARYKADLERVKELDK